jgi:lipopolysaccharide/colanic/teichoic acid biosynthesis glycosyltransferase
MIWRHYFKRGFDTVVSFLLLVILSPLLLVLALLVRIFLGSPVLFRQPRPGLGETIFTMFKFRTMNDARDAAGALLPDERRLPPFGAFLRSTSLDELPELFNVLRGEMSLVGPRPLLARYLPRYTPRQRRRMEVRPGITGWAQVNGRNAITWEQRFEYDVWYVENLGFLLDMKILLLTLVRTASRSGITPEDAPAMPEFLGSPVSPPGDSTPHDSEVS